MEHFDFSEAEKTLLFCVVSGSEPGIAEALPPCTACERYAEILENVANVVLGPAGARVEFVEEPAGELLFSLHGGSGALTVVYYDLPVLSDAGRVEVGRKLVDATGVATIHFAKATRVQ